MRFRSVLKAHRAKNPDTKYVFEGWHLAPLDILSIGSNKIREILTAKKQTWYGWHAFRRGLCTNLRALGVELETIAAILRHTDSKVTKQRYAKPSDELNAAMEKFGKRVSQESA